MHCNGKEKWILCFLSRTAVHLHSRGSAHVVPLIFLTFSIDLHFKARVFTLNLLQIHNLQLKSIIPAFSSVILSVSRAVSVCPSFVSYSLFPKFLSLDICFLSISDE
ncbi:hypothetical protein L6164_000582 [Bauhinia variegata]|uniref:Uncharacterized protein n=1 Tax=Bauhinia variegata TaxID=167791 RepID=A0ACB9Q935_BAUVA|nr:hypothetical protein L6164_000582 [Bauhinia variegata]